MRIESNVITAGFAGGNSVDLAPKSSSTRTEGSISRDLFDFSPFSPDRSVGSNSRDESARRRQENAAKMEAAAKAKGEQLERMEQAAKKSAENRSMLGWLNAGLGGLGGFALFGPMGALFGALSGGGATLAGGIFNFAKGAVDAAGSAAQSVAEGVGSAVDAAGDAAKSVAEGAKKVVSDVGDAISSLF